MDVEILEANQPNLVETLALLQPEIVIMEASHPQDCSLNRLFDVLPNLIVMEVSLNASSVQLIRSDRYDASGFAGFLSVLESVRANLNDALNPMPTLQPHE